MTTIDTHAAAAPVGDSRAAGRLATVSDWVTTTDHKRIGRLFIGVSLLALVGIGAVAALLGFERANTGTVLLDRDAWPQLFSLYRVGLTFGALVPLLLGVAVAVVPLQVGARSLAFPRVAAAGFWSWLIGLGIVVGAILGNGGPNVGDHRAVALFLVGHILVLVGLLAATVSVATTILTTRAPGMNMRRVPFFSWSVLVGALGLLVSLPVLLGTLIYTYIDYRYGGNGFEGNAGIMKWIGFGFTQPQTIVYAIPVFGFAAEVVATATRRRFPMRGIAFSGVGLVGVAALGGVLQNPSGLRKDIVDASFGTALNDIVPYAFFNLLPLLGGLVVLGALGLALSKGRPAISAPFVFGFLGAGMVLTGIAANAVYLIGDAQLGGTVFEEASWIYVVYGGVLAGLGGVAYWGPKLWGRSLPMKATLPLAGLGFIATVLAALPYVIAGFAKQAGGVLTNAVTAADYPDYSGPHQLWNVLSGVGHGLMALTVLAFIGLALKTFTSSDAADAAGDDPWNGQTLEWATSSPAPADNFAEVHTVASAEPLIDLKPGGTA